MNDVKLAKLTDAEFHTMLGFFCAWSNENSAVLKLLISKAGFDYCHHVNPIAAFSK